MKNISFISRAKNDINAFNHSIALGQGGMVMFAAQVNNTEVNRVADTPVGSVLQKERSGAKSTPSMSDSDSDLVKRVQHGDKRAFDLLVLKYQHKIQSLVSRYVRDADVQDVAQEAFIKAFRAIKNFRAESAFYTWLYRIAVNTAKNHIVSRSRRPPDSDVDVAETDGYSGENVLQDIETPQNSLQAEQVGNVVRQALDELPNDLRTALTLREFDGLSYESIAEIMECPVGTVRSRIFRAREAIDKVVRPMMSA